MAEQKAPASEAAAPPPAPPSGKQPFLLIILAVVNMLVVLGVGLMVWQAKKKEASAPKIEHVIQGEKEAQEEDHKEVNPFVGNIIPLETFIVNLSGSKGRRIAKVNIELQVNGKEITNEFDQRKAQIRDIIIILISGKTYDEVSTKEGKEGLRAEIKDTVNNFLTKGRIEQVYFTEFIYN